MHVFKVCYINWISLNGYCSLLPILWLTTWMQSSQKTIFRSSETQWRNMWIILKVSRPLTKKWNALFVLKRSVWSVYCMGDHNYFQDIFLLKVIFTLWAHFRANPPCQLFAYSYYCLSCVFRYNILVIIRLNIIYCGFDFFEFIIVDVKCHPTWQPCFRKIPFSRKC